MKKIKKYFLSRVASNQHDLMRVLPKRFKNKGYNLIYRKKILSKEYLLNNKNYLGLIIEIIFNFFWKVKFYLFFLFIRNSKIIIVWPQISGLENVLRIIKNNKVILYIMDNFFFCIRSYNTHPETLDECLNCVGFIKPHELCAPYPVDYNKSKNIELLQELKLHSNKIIFYAQNKLQKELLLKHFGKETVVKIVGMNIVSLDESLEIKQNKVEIYDAVFHAKSVKAKGLDYFVNLAELLPNKTFLIPDTKKNVSEVLVDKKLPDNITFKFIKWDTGLKDFVRSARLVIIPSVWSAPIESALIKSAAINKNIATVMSEYGYENEIKTIHNHLRLSKNVFEASKQIESFLS